VSFVYPRTISVYRLPRLPTSPAGFGAQGYQEPQTAASASVWATRPILSGIRCSIQEYRSGQRPADDLPGSTLVTPTNKIFIPVLTLPKGAIKVRDYLLDDIGVRYHVINPYWNSLGYRLYCVFLET
jgi:hypothetical protein